jgi:hypothetical protein
MAWRVLRFRREDLPPIWNVAANILNKESWTADSVWSSTFGVGRGVSKTLRKKLALLRNAHTFLGPGLILWYELRNGKETYFVDGMLVACMCQVHLQQ